MRRQQTRLAELSNPPPRQSPLFRQGTPVCEWTLDEPPIARHTGSTVKSRTKGSHCLSPAWGPRLFEVGQAGSAGHCALRSGGAGKECPGDAPGPSRPLGRAAPRPVWISGSAGAASPSCPVPAVDPSANMRSAGRNAPMAPRCARRRLTPSPPTLPPKKGLLARVQPAAGALREGTQCQPPPSLHCLS